MKHNIKATLIAAGTFEIYSSIHAAHIALNISASIIKMCCDYPNKVRSISPKANDLMYVFAYTDDPPTKIKRKYGRVFNSEAEADAWKKERTKEVVKQSAARCRAKREAPVVEIDEYTKSYQGYNEIKKVFLLNLTGSLNKYLNLKGVKEQLDELFIKLTMKE
jgi:hypothetical protein